MKSRVSNETIFDLSKEKKKITRTVKYRPQYLSYRLYYYNKIRRVVVVVVDVGTLFPLGFFYSLNWLFTPTKTSVGVVIW